jgi:hypothetical protein
MMEKPHRSAPGKPAGTKPVRKVKVQVQRPDPPIVSEVPGMSEEWKKFYRLFMAGWDE